MYKCSIIFSNSKVDTGLGNNTNADTNGVKSLIENCPQLEWLVHRQLFGNYTLRSHSLKFLNLSSCGLDSICLDCPSLEKLVCHNPAVVGNTSTSALAEAFGVDEVAFMKEYQEVYGRRPSSNIIRSSSVSIIPSDSIVSSVDDFFRVGTIVVLFCILSCENNKTINLIDSSMR